MSTFLGLIMEIPGISVDRFDKENLNSSVYFLSHCHSDHMQGLSDTFFKHLKQFNKSFYCSPISKVFLETKYQLNYDIATCIKVLEINDKEIVPYESVGYSLSVTFISAGHCPGSVMFLFETPDKLVLYTGDFRINPRDYSKQKALHYRRDSTTIIPKKLTKIYLDTTFLSRDFICFPTREESKDVVCKVAKKWLEKSPRKVVILECSANYGSEFLYMELFDALGIPIHVKDFVYKSYERIPVLANCITNNPLITRIHACMKKQDRSGLICRADVLDEDILTIVPSVQRWKGRDTSVVGEWDKNRERTFNVCYSMHPSFHELKIFVQYFKPKDVHACVCPRDVKHTIFRLLNEIRN